MMDSETPTKNKDGFRRTETKRMRTKMKNKTYKKL
jgi:hypothetical protein